MKTLRLASYVIGLALILSANAAAQEKSLFERLGGKEAITAVVDDFMARAAADTRINGKFANSDMTRLRFHLIEQVCAATGGPCTYAGRDMTKAHKNMGVTEGEFNALVEDLVASLDKFNVPAKEKNELLGLLAPMKAQIVEVNSPQTGTALPNKFKPAPPLNAAETTGGKKAKGSKKAKDETKAAKDETKATKADNKKAKDEAKAEAKKVKDDAKKAKDAESQSEDSSKKKSKDSKKSKSDSQ